MIDTVTLVACQSTFLKFGASAEIPITSRGFKNGPPSPVYVPDI